MGLDLLSEAAKPEAGQGEGLFATPARSCRPSPPGGWSTQGPQSEGAAGAAIPLTVRSPGTPDPTPWKLHPARAVSGGRPHRLRRCRGWTPRSRPVQTRQDRARGSSTRRAAGPMRSAQSTLRGCVVFAQRHRGVPLHPQLYRPSAGSPQSPCTLRISGKMPAPSWQSLVSLLFQRHRREGDPVAVRREPVVGLAAQGRSSKHIVETTDDRRDGVFQNIQRTHEGGLEALDTIGSTRAGTGGFSAICRSPSSPDAPDHRRRRVACGPAPRSPPG